MDSVNPFSFSAATDLEAEDLLFFYIQEYNYSRFIQSKRNVFLLGERGSGKTMTLLYHSVKVQRLEAEQRGSSFDLKKVGVYVPCNTPLISRADHELLDEYRAFTLSEHFLSLSIVDGVVGALEGIQDEFDEFPDDELCEEVEAVLAIDLPQGNDLVSRIRRFVGMETRKTQLAINLASEDFYSGAFSFATLVLPLLEVLATIPALKGTHFLLMLDDADYLNRHQIAALNSWIAYRDNSRFSFKVATSKVTRPPRVTASGGTIAEGHDFIVLDMENPLHNERSDFGRMAKMIIARRLSKIASDVQPNDFFPVSPKVVEQLEKCKLKAEKVAREKYPQGSPKQISDYIYKYHRAIFFRRRHKANRPVYSGFEMVVYLSTGVVRNLLEPCYVMYEKAISRATELGQESILSIEPTIQNEVILALSGRPWEKITDGLHNHVANCTKEQADQIQRLFEALARLFRQRLLSDSSEPRATSFTISGGSDENREQIEALLTIARKALLVYVRSGPAKEAGSRETYYVPTRMLWPVRGLDPLGQHARVSLKARDMMAAALGETSPWSEIGESTTQPHTQATLFDEQD